MTYITCDLASDPPTPVTILRTATGNFPVINQDTHNFAITADCVESTEGWVSREGKPNLTICFMHSFGKCTGRTNGDPSTCYQIHIHSKVLNALRRYYTNPPRAYFTRTVKAQLGQELRAPLSFFARKELKVQYLEYRVQDVQPTTGLSQYEATYRQWLFDETAKKENFNISVMQCTSFASTGFCANGEQCPYIHAAVKQAQVRDVAVARALRDFNEMSTALASPVNPPHAPPPSHAHQAHAPQLSAPPHAALQPVPPPPQQQQLAHSHPDDYRVSDADEYVQGFAQMVSASADITGISEKQLQALLPALQYYHAAYYANRGAAGASPVGLAPAPLQPPIRVGPPLPPAPYAGQVVRPSSRLGTRQALPQPWLQQSQPPHTPPGHVFAGLDGGVPVATAMGTSTLSPAVTNPTTPTGSGAIPAATPSDGGSASEEMAWLLNQLQVLGPPASWSSQGYSPTLNVLNVDWRP